MHMCIYPCYCTWEIEIKMEFDNELSFSSHWKIHLYAKNAEEAPNRNYTCFKSVWVNPHVTIVFVFLQVGKLTDFVDFVNNGWRGNVLCLAKTGVLLIMAYPVMLATGSKFVKRFICHSAL